MVQQVSAPVLLATQQSKVSFWMVLRSNIIVRRELRSDAGIAFWLFSLHWANKSSLLDFSHWISLPPVVLKRRTISQNFLF